MTIEKFLSFWSHYNTAIIESLVALIIISSLFLAFRSFFSKKNKEDGIATGHSEIDTSQIEKTLQKILENQAKGGGPARASAEDHGVATDLSSLEKQGGAMMESPAEVSQLRLTLNETHKKVEVLQAQLAEAQQKVQAAEAAVSAGGGGEAPSGTGASSQELDDLNNKIRDLEARLAEYEIISEDIADLSKYREENEQLRKELEAARAAGAAAPAAAPAPAPVAEPTPSAPVVEPVAEAPVEPMEAVSTDAGAGDLIDEDLMKEFAAAVEGQKAAAAAEKAEAAAAAKEAPSEAPPADDTEKLMDEFENFVAKKS